MWVTPYYEEDMRKLADTRSASSACCSVPTGPTARAWRTRVDFVKELHDFSDDEIRKVMRDNTLELLDPAGASA